MNMPVRSSARKIAQSATRVPSDYLYRTWSFRLAALAVLVSATSYLDAAVHGLAGFLVLFALATLAALLSDASRGMFWHVRCETVLNRFLVLCAIWYAVGVIVKTYVLGSGETDWRLATQLPQILLCILFGFAFFHEDRAVRILQIGLILFLGVQSFFTGRLILQDPAIVRASVNEAWAFGTQGGFAMNAMVLPILVYRALAEKGSLRLLLLGSCVVIFFTTVISTFGTAVGLLLLGLLVAMALGLVVLPPKLKVRLVIVAALLSVAWVFYGGYAWQHSILEIPRYRLTRLVEDPQAGGSSEKNVGSSRWALAELSLKSFIEHPLLGAGTGRIYHSEVIGGHSSLLDSLGFYGLLGGGGAFVGLLLAFFVRAMKRLVRNRSLESVFVATSVCLLLVGGIVNPYWQGPYPMMVFLLGRLYRLPGEPK